MMLTALIAACILQAHATDVDFVPEDFLAPWQETLSATSKMLIFSMVGITAALAEMILKSKDNRMQKLGFFLRIGL
eukprot:CAMPEP_0181491802 /NCGR_PEP_ID=MMETSP1110-20121109/50337_1 /TAXON_ID=174948 /ORGANISM="Symbiodinium sp., Strain CCMP421" /LENGTH=75 /DNA_ID=CAMNT_0023618981 /DNA_START=68 /DNA_END=295 /DNA_ORIENTATION=+